mgnify:CR=1 FL=1
MSDLHLDKLYLNISPREILDLASNEAVYSTGLQMAEAGAVLSAIYTFAGISCIVRENASSSYLVTLTLADNHTLQRTKCRCRAFANSYGSCQHIVAALIVLRYVPLGRLKKLSDFAQFIRENPRLFDLQLKEAQLALLDSRENFREADDTVNGSRQMAADLPAKLPKSASGSAPLRAATPTPTPDTGNSRTSASLDAHTRIKAPPCALSPPETNFHSPLAAHGKALLTELRRQNRLERLERNWQQITDPGNKENKLLLFPEILFFPVEGQPGAARIAPPRPPGMSRRIADTPPGTEQHETTLVILRFKAKLSHTYRVRNWRELVTNIKYGRPFVLGKRAAYDPALATIEEGSFRLIDWLHGLTRGSRLFSAQQIADLTGQQINQHMLMLNSAHCGRLFTLLRKYPSLQRRTRVALWKPGQSLVSDLRPLRVTVDWPPISLTLTAKPDEADGSTQRNSSPHWQLYYLPNLRTKINRKHCLPGSDVSRRLPNNQSHKPRVCPKITTLNTVRPAWYCAGNIYLAPTASRHSMGTLINLLINRSNDNPFDPIEFTGRETAEFLELLPETFLRSDRFAFAPSVGSQINRAEMVPEIFLDMRNGIIEAGLRVHYGVAFFDPDPLSPWEYDVDRGCNFEETADVASDATPDAEATTHGATTDLSATETVNSATNASVNREPGTALNAAVQNRNVAPPLLTIRRREQEAEIIHILLNAGFKADRNDPLPAPSATLPYPRRKYKLRGTKAISDFILNVLPKLHDRARIMATAAFRKTRVTPFSFTPSLLRLIPQENELRLDLHRLGYTEEDLRLILSAYQEQRGFVRLKDNRIIALKDNILAGKAGNIAYPATDSATNSHATSPFDPAIDFTAAPSAPSDPSTDSAAEAGNSTADPFAATPGDSATNAIKDAPADLSSQAALDLWQNLSRLGGRWEGQNLVFNRYSLIPLLVLFAENPEELEKTVDAPGDSAINAPGTDTDAPGTAGFANGAAARPRLDRIRTLIETDTSTRAALRALAHPEQQGHLPSPAIAARLRPYQLYGFQWLCTLSEHGFGGILADEMGLGKTIQALAYIQHLRTRRPEPVLVVVPTSLVFNWQAEAARFTPDLPVLTMSGLPDERRANLEQADETAIYIMSYSVLRRDIDIVSRIQFSACFLDEAQMIKNPHTQTAMAVRQIRATHRFAMTGTPVENNLIELWSIFNFIMPGYLGNEQNFRRNFVQEIGLPAEAGNLSAEADNSPAEAGISATNASEKVNASSAKTNGTFANGNGTPVFTSPRLELLRRLTAPFILRRLKSEVLTELPDKVESVVGCGMTEEQRAVYYAELAKARLEVNSWHPADKAEENRRRIMILSLLTRLRQICCHPSLYLENYDGGSGKLDMALTLIEESIEGGDRILLFSQYTSMLAILRRHLNERGYTYFYIDGKTPTAERLELTEAFNRGERDLFLISLRAGGTGLNLTGANTVIHYDPWWNPAVTNQATDRAHRIGQDKEVNTLHLITAHSIEERVRRLQEAKQSLLDGILAPQTQTGLAGLSLDDLKSLLEP